MQIDNIRIDPWIPTVRRTTLMLMLACFGVGILIGSLTAEKIVVTQTRVTTAAEPIDPAASSSSAKDGGRPSREPENRRSRTSNAQEEASAMATPPAALPSSTIEGGGASRESENRPSRASNTREEASDTATPPAVLLNPGTANEYQVRHKREARPARMMRGRKLDRPSPDASGERVEGRHPARDYHDLRNQVLNQ
jgi:hypothetical protein